jgi:medium-chain acyl-[acyl-carrier-protein] hydrolase
VQLPGREQRQHELPFTRMDDLIEALASVLDPYLDRPFGFFGHGAGALVAFYLARRLRRLGAPLPDRLWVSACRAPQLPRRAAPLSLLPAEAFVAEVRRRGLVPPGMLEKPEQLALVLPALAADMAAGDLARYEPEAPLASPIDVLGGMRDTTVAWWELQAWRAQTAGRFRLRLLPGGHWYLQENPELLVQGVGGGL